MLTAVRYRETRSVGDDRARPTIRAGRRGSRRGSSQRLERLGVYERESRRGSRTSPSPAFATRAAAQRRPLPDLGEVVPSDAAVMISRLRPGGAQYEVFESVSLGG